VTVPRQRRPVARQETVSRSRDLSTFDQEALHLGAGIFVEVTAACPARWVASLQ